MREIDRLTVENHHTCSLLLIEAARAACMEAIRTRLDGNLENKKALILCGKGNNGGQWAPRARVGETQTPPGVVRVAREPSHVPECTVASCSLGSSRKRQAMPAPTLNPWRVSQVSRPARTRRRRRSRLSSVRVSARGNNWQSRAA